jgi:hypothetical protein
MGGNFGSSVEFFPSSTCQSLIRKMGDIETDLIAKIYKISENEAKN